MQKLDSIDKWKALLQESKVRPVLIFKYVKDSEISTLVQGRLARSETMEVITEPVHMVIVNDCKDVSDDIVNVLGVTHQSPQIIVVRNGQAVYDESQERIMPETIEDYILENE